MTNTANRHIVLNGFKDFTENSEFLQDIPLRLEKVVGVRTPLLPQTQTQSGIHHYSTPAGSNYRRGAGMNEHSKADETYGSFIAKNATRYLWTGQSLRCVYSHEVSAHRTILEVPFIACCDVNGRRCPYKEFMPYRDISEKVEVA